jgi:hypothetical protein
MADDPRRRRMLVLFARSLVAAVAITAAAVGIVATRHQDRCDAVMERVLRIERGTPRAEEIAIKRDLLADCPNPRDAVVLARALEHVRRHTIALDLSRAMTRRNPEDYAGWLLRSLTEDTRAQQQAALRRLDELRPRQ